MIESSLVKYANTRPNITFIFIVKMWQELLCGLGWCKIKLLLKSKNPQADFGF